MKWIREIACLTVLLSACSSGGSSSSTPTATTDFDPGFDFSGVRKIAIQPIHRTPESQAVLSDIQIGRVNESLTAELQRRGFELVTDNADADMLLVWHLVTEERTDVRTYNSMSYYNCWRCGPNVSDVSRRHPCSSTHIQVALRFTHPVLTLCFFACSLC